MPYDIYYVDTDVVGGAGDGSSWANAYSTLQAANVAEAGDITAGNPVQFLCRGSVNDTAAVTITGWTTDADSWVEVKADDFPSDGKWDDTKYILHNNDTTHAIYLYEDYVRLVNLQLMITTTSGTKYGIRVSARNASNYILLQNLIIRGVSSGAGSRFGIWVNDTDAIVDIVNCVVYGFISGSADCYGIHVSIAVTVDIYNSTISDCYRGVRRNGGAVTAINTVVFNCYSDWHQDVIANYCASDDADAVGGYTNGQNFTAEATDWNKIFTDYSNGDFRLKNYTTEPCCRGKGTDDPASGLYSTDIAGSTRSSPWDIGAFGATGALHNFTAASKAFNFNARNKSFNFNARTR